MPQGPPVREWRHGREAAELCLRRHLGREREKERERERKEK